MDQCWETQGLPLNALRVQHFKIHYPHLDITNCNAFVNKKSHHALKIPVGIFVTGITRHHKDDCED